MVGAGVGGLSGLWRAAFGARHAARGRADSGTLGTATMGRTSRSPPGEGADAGAGGTKRSAATRDSRDARDARGARGAEPAQTSTNNVVGCNLLRHPPIMSIYHMKAPWMPLLGRPYEC